MNTLMTEAEKKNIGVTEFWLITWIHLSINNEDWIKICFRTRLNINFFGYNQGYNQLGYNQVTSTKQQNGSLKKKNYSR